MRRGRRGQRGAVLLEYLLVLPLLLLLAFGTAETGLAWVSSNKLEGAVSTAARTGSSSGAVDGADNAILMSLQVSLPQELLDNIERVVVYRSDSNGGRAANCMTNTPGTGVGSGGATTPAGSGTGATRCNVYSGNTVRTATASTNLVPLGGGSWLPSARRDSLADPPDYLGVLVRTRHDTVTGMFWNSFTLTDSSIYRIQPDIDG